MQAATQPTTKYKVGDIFTFQDKSYFYKVVGIDFPFYKLEGFYKNSSECTYKYNEEINYIDSNEYIILWNEFKIKTAESACECGAHKLGYVKPSRHHYGWCPFYRET